jgi:hypothetical protein
MSVDVRVESRTAWRVRRPYKIIIAIVAVAVREGTFLNYLPNISSFKLLDQNHVLSNSNK